MIDRDKMFDVTKVLKHRWAEVLLIVGLETAAGYAMLQLPIGQKPTAEDLAVTPLAALLFVTFWVVSNLLLLGFLRTSFSDGPMRYEPHNLLKIGYHYFWRMVGVSLIIGAIVAIFIAAFIALAKATLYNNSEIPATAINVCVVIATILLVKPTLLAPAAIVVLDCGLGHAFAAIRHLKLLGAPRMLGLFLIIQGIVVTQIFIPRPADRTYDQAISVAFAFVTSLISIGAYLYAVKYVAWEYIAKPQQDDSTEMENS